VKRKIDPNSDWNELDFEKLFLPGLSVDTVIFGFHEGQLMVLLLQYKNTHAFALPGGLILKEENADQAAYRTLKSRTGLSDIYLEQFHIFSDKDRCNPSFFKGILKARGVRALKNHFLLTRFVSIAYYALIDFTKAVPAADGLADACRWHDLKNLPPLIQDHAKIIQKALASPAITDRKLVGFSLLPDLFTMGELQVLYETILNEKFRRTSFQRKMLKIGNLEKVDKKWTGAAHKAPFLYKFVKN
jgi:ADP-ribose pyrophosphatase YjhB (NUDIX family)